MVDIHDYFKQHGQGTKRKNDSKDVSSVKKSKPSSSKKQVVINLDDEERDYGYPNDDEDDDALMEIDEMPKNTKKKSASSTSKPKSKTSTKKSTTNTAKAQDSSVLSILASIPDADLPEIDPEAKKLSFPEIQANRNAIETSSTTRDLPEAQPNCLSGLTIVFTGQMPGLDRGTAESIAQRYGAKVTKSISGKTSLVVLGAEAGPSKIKKIHENKIKTIDEDGFIQLLEKMPLDGGSGDNAQKAKEKRELEEKQILETAAREEEEERLEQERKKKEAESSAKQNKQQNQQQQTEDEFFSTYVPPPPVDVPVKDKLWTVKHAPKDFNQLCGNKGQIRKLHDWLSDWYKNQANGFKGNFTQPSTYRAALISGPPGIGKTSAAHLVAKSLGFDILEKNASDVRSKSLLNAQVKSVLNNTSVVGFFKHKDDENKNSNNKKICLIMDEVDGMSTGDHGGTAALAQFCRITKMPIILICNDKSLPKMKVFDKTTYELPFQRPKESEIRSRLMTIATREGIKLDPNVIIQMVQATSNDIRQMINLLSTVSRTQKSLNHENINDIQASWKKQVILKPFDIAGRLLSSGIWVSPKQNINEKLDLYFNDIDFAPLMIQENYLNVNSRLGGNPLNHVAQAADDISASDEVNSLIRSSEQQWSLLPFHGLLSTIKPSFEIAGNLKGRLNFSSWLGQNSKQMKFQRILQELQYHTRIKTSTTKQELRLDYLYPLYIKIHLPLKNGDVGINEAIETMDDYYLTKEDYDNILEMLNKTNDLDTKEKTAFTKKYNSKTHPTVIYKTGNSLGGSGKRQPSQKVDYEDVVEDDIDETPDDNEDENDDKIDSKKDKLIKAKVKGKGAKSTATKGGKRGKK
ncbi:rfc1 [Candida pseudojiufengensis]|uniref:rfc1 n=1 Tax=Candida pseudojiufengensis TaxID=497109 RepID=UPI002224DDC1|nr:rfc1 [Candida pseudojiufengensis]KAI5959011.1 rfc1 [Candida pseudojiufengensis]